MNKIKNNSEFIKESSLLVDNFKNIDRVSRYIIDSHLSNGDGPEKILSIEPFIDFEVNKTSALDLIRWSVDGSIPLMNRIKEIEKDCINNTTTKDEISWWLSAFVWGVMMVSYKSIPLNGLTVWLDTAKNDDNEESTWVCLQNNIVQIRRDWWGGTVWKGSRDVSISRKLSIDKTGIASFMSGKLEYISWQDFNNSRTCH